MNKKQTWIEIMAFTIRGTDYTLYATQQGVCGDHKVVRTHARQSAIIIQGDFNTVRTGLLAAIKGTHTCNQ